LTAAALAINETLPRIYGTARQELLSGDATLEIGAVWRARGGEGGEK
jgi:hypothetical protein